ncbi:MAG: 2-oxoglutarate dehydrogenase E1 component, partial [Flavobacteriaceae bacterium]
KHVKTLVFCSGKFYYDLIDARANKDRMDVAVVRLEQLFPLPHEEIQAQIQRYSNLQDVVWAQEEPRNMGAWGYLLLHLPEAQQMRPATRRYYGSPAAGSAVRFKNRHQQVIDYVFDPALDNFIRKKSKSS